MEMKQVVVVRGSIVIPFGKSPRGSGGRSFSNHYLARPGERVMLPASEAARLIQLGFVRLVT